MVFTCWVGRPESAQGSGCLSTSPQTTLSCTKPLSESSPRENKLIAKIYSWGFHARICSPLGLYSLQLPAIRKVLQQVAGQSQHWRPFPGPHSRAPSSRPLAIGHQFSPVSADPERKSKLLWLLGGFLPALLLCPGLHLPDSGLLGDWDFFKLHWEQDHLLLLQ